MSKWRVDSFHLGLADVGDSAMHLLVEMPSVPLQPGIVRWAMLVDGGSGGEKEIRTTIEWIEKAKRYNLTQLGPDGSQKLTFDAVIISHWDTDHYRGIFNAMRDDVSAQVKAGKSPEDLTISFFRYKRGPPREPQTIVYCPEMGFILKKPVSFAKKPDNAKPTTMDFCAGNNIKVEGACVVRMEPVQQKPMTILGTDVLSGNDLKCNPKDVKSPADLVTSMNPTQDARPGIYIVAVSTRVIGTDPKQFAASPEEVTRALDGVGVVDETKPGTPSNKSSIACMVIWPAHGPAGPRLSHYFGGDMHWQEEKALVKWTGADGNRNTVSRFVTSMKLSHHGAMSSTPTMMLDLWNPYNLVASVSEKNGHPSWPLLFYVEGWMYVGDANKAAYRPFLSTQFPYYLAREKTNDPDGREKWLNFPTGRADQMSMKVLTDTGGVAKVYRGELKQEWARAATALKNNSGRSLLSPLEDWEATKNTKPTVDAKDWARKRIADAWSQLSPTPPTAHPARSASRVSTNHQLVNPTHMLSFFIIESKDDMEQDGAVWVKYDGSQELNQLRPDSQAVPPVTGSALIPLLGNSDVALFPVPVSASDTGKRPGSPSILNSVSPPLKRYCLSAGTNPNENDGLLSDAMDSLARPLSGDSGIGDDNSEDKVLPILEPQPEPGIPGLPEGTPPSLQEPFYFICASNVEFSSAPGPEVKQLAPTDDLNSFLSTFHQKGLILAAQPENTKPVSLHSQDEFLRWLSLCLAAGAGDCTPVQFLVTTDLQNSPYITQFDLTIPFLGGSTYSSSATVRQLRVQPGWGLGPAGTVPWQNSMVLGLTEAKAGKNLSLSAVLQPAISRGAELPGLTTLRQLADNHTLAFDIDNTDGSRNALWFEASAAYKTVVRTQYAATESSVQKLNNWINGLVVGFRIDSITVITKFRSTWVSTCEEQAALNHWEIVLNGGCSLIGPNQQPLPIKPFMTLDFNETVMTITLQFDYATSNGGELLGEILDWVAMQKPPLQDVHLDLTDRFREASEHNFNPPLLRRLILVVELEPDGSLPASIDSLSVDLELGIKFGQPGGAQPENVVFLFTYQWSTDDSGNSLRGSLWCPPPPDGDVRRELLPEYEPYLKFEPVSVGPDSAWASALDLTNLIPSDPSSGQSGEPINHIPDGIPTEVTLAVLSLDETGIYFDGALECDQPQSKAIPPLLLSRIHLDARYLYDMGFAIHFDFGSTMFPDQTSGIFPIELCGTVQCDTKDCSWSVAASVETPGMQGAHLLNFFDAAAGPTATSLIQHIKLNYLDLSYLYAKGTDGINPARLFRFSGSMSVGLLELDLQFEYPRPNQWTFTADIGAAGGAPCTIQEILDSIVGDGTVDLPSCVGDITVRPPAAAVEGAAEGAVVSQGLFKLTFEKLQSNSGAVGPRSDQETQDVICTVTANIGAIAFNFLQFRNTSWDVKKSCSKRFFRLEVTKMPNMDIPVIGNLSQPFEEMYFMWVQDGNPSRTASSPPGFTKAEVNTLNNDVLKDNPIYYKLTKDDAAYADTDVWVEAGCHFVLVAKDAKSSPVVLMDYVFAKPSPSTSVPPPALALQRHARRKLLLGPDAVVRTKRRETRQNLVSANITEIDTPVDNANAGGGIQKTAYKVSIGPFAISNIGLKFSNSVLSVCLDASVDIGPIAMNLVGFSINLDFGDGSYHLDNLPVPGKGMDFSLNGLGVSFDQPPLTIAGALVRAAVNQNMIWAGGVDIGFDPWAFLAAGAYGELHKPDNPKETFTTTFVFAQLKGPLITLEFATIEGVTGGFGYNNSLKLPTVAEVPSFPLIAVPTPTAKTGNATMDMLMALISSPKFRPQDGSFWVAAGLTVTAFQMLQITAVMVAEWDPAVKLGIYAVAIADIPSTAAVFKIAHVELGILATIDLSKGIAAFEAQLAPSSFILDPMCHLSGAFALYYWFKDGSDQRHGDWVFSMGGYHPGYKAPAQYPNPPRLQIQWLLGPLSITGQAYFAITPNACMAGAGLHVSLSIGVLQAFFDGYADFLINYKPFNFRSTGGVSVGVRYTLDLLFTTAHINVEIGAKLILLGPPFQGSIYVDFWVFGFTIHFGAAGSPDSTPVTLQDFYYLALQKGSPTASRTPPTPHKIMCQSGLLCSTSSSALRQAHRRAAQRAGSATSLVHAGQGGPSIDIADESRVWEVHAGTFTFSISSVFALSEVTLSLDRTQPIRYPAPKPDTVDIYSRSMHLTESHKALSSNLVISISMDLPQSVEPPVEPPRWELKPIIQQLPLALWDVYDPKADPSGGSTAFLDGTKPSTAPLMNAVLLVPPPPVLSADAIQPFDADVSQGQTAADSCLPPLSTSANVSWLPVEPTTPPIDPAQPWKTVQALWNMPSLGAGTAAAVAEGWASCMGWDQNKLGGEVPTRLVDGLQDLYAAAPMVAAMS